MKSLINNFGRFFINNIIIDRAYFVASWQIFYPYRGAPRWGGLRLEVIIAITGRSRNGGVLHHNRKARMSSATCSGTLKPCDSNSSIKAACKYVCSDLHGEWGLGHAKPVAGLDQSRSSLRYYLLESRFSWSSNNHWVERFGGRRIIFSIVYSYAC